MSWKNPGKTRARTYGTKSPSRSEAVRLIDSAKSPSTKIDGSLVNFRRRLSNRHGRPQRMLTIDIRIHQWTIYFCRWGFGWVDKAHCFQSATWFGAISSSLNFSGIFSRHLASRHLNLSRYSHVLHCRTQANSSHFNKKSTSVADLDSNQEYVVA